MAGFLDNLRAVGGDIADGLGNAASNFAGGFAPPADLNAIDPSSGFPEGDLQQAKMDSLRRMSALLIAAGSTNGNARAEILSKLGDNDTAKSLYNTAQARLMNNRTRDAERERQRKANALDKLRNADLNELTDREKEVFGLYLDGGDPDNALNYLKSIRQAQNQEIPFPDGSFAPRGVMQQNARHYQANYEPILRDRVTSLTNWNMLDDAVGAMNSGAAADMQTWVQNYGTALGLTNEQQHQALTNTQTFKALTLPLILANMKQLGGSDSNEELKTLSAQWSTTNDPSVLKKMVDLGRRKFFRDVATAQYKADSLQKDGQRGYNQTPSFDPSNLPSDVRTEYDRLYGGKPAGTGSAPSAAAGAGGGIVPGTIEDGYRFKGGNPADPNAWEKVK